MKSNKANTDYKTDIFTQVWAATTGLAQLLLTLKTYVMILKTIIHICIWEQYQVSFYLHTSQIRLWGHLSSDPYCFRTRRWRSGLAV